MLALPSAFEYATTAPNLEMPGKVWQICDRLLLTWLMGPQAASRAVALGATSLSAGPGWRKSAGALGIGDAAPQPRYRSRRGAQLADNTAPKTAFRPTRPPAGRRCFADEALSAPAASPAVAPNAARFRAGVANAPPRHRAARRRPSPEA